MHTLIRVLLVFLFAWLFYEGISQLVGDSGGINQRRIGLAVGAIALGVAFVVIRQKSHDKRRALRRKQDVNPHRKVE